MALSDNKAKLYKLLSDDKVNEVIKEIELIANQFSPFSDRFEKIYPELALLSARAKAIDSQEIQGVLRREELFIERNRIRASLMKIIQKIPNEVEKFDIRNIKTDIKRERNEDNAGVMFITNQISEWKKSQVFPTIGLIIFDVDDFTVINRKYGYEAGNEIIKELFDVLEKSIENVLGEKYPMDVSIDFDYGRLGRDEYFVLFKSIEEVDVVYIANYIHKKIASYNWDMIAFDLRVSVSLGVSIFRYREEIISWVIRTLLAVQVVKKQGKNNVKIASKILPPKAPISRSIWDYHFGMRHKKNSQLILRDCS